MRFLRSFKGFTRKSPFLWLWLAATILLCLLIIFEFIEHRPFQSNNLSNNFLVEIILVGLSLIFLALYASKQLFVSDKDHLEGNWPEPINKNGKNGVQRVLIVPGDSLLGAGIESLLSKDSRLEIQGLDTDDEATLIEEVKRYQPNVIVLEEVESLADSVDLLNLFSFSPHLRVVGVSSDSGLVKVYDKNQFSITDSSEFVRFITGDAKI